MALTTSQIQSAYVTFFNRPADTLGLNHWLASGNDMATLLAEFSTSVEYTAQYAGKNPLEIVNTIYNNLFGRDAELDGLVFWSQHLADGNLTIANIADQISKSAQTTDATAFANKTAAAVAFTAALDTPVEVRGYAGPDALAAARAFIASVSTDASLATAITALSASVTAVTTAGNAAAAAGQTYLLTTGVDSGAAFTGTAGNDTFSASSTLLPADGVTVLQTLTALDTINGGAGSDVLNVVSTDAYGLLSSVTLTSIETVNVRAAGAVTGTTASGYADTTALNVTQATSVAVTAAATTAVSVSGATTSVAIDGGSTQTVTTGGSTVTLGATTGAAGAINVTHTAQAANAIAIDGGTSVNVTSTGRIAAGTIVIGGDASPILPTGAVTITASEGLASAGTAALITVKGGSTVAITENITGSAAAITTAATSGGPGVVTGGAITVAGKAVTTAVTVTQTAAKAAVNYVAATATVPATTGVLGVVNGAVTITDVNSGDATLANTLATVTLNNFAAATVNSAALATLNLSGTGTSVAVTQGALTTATTTTQAVNVNGLTLTGALTLDNDITTLNIASATTKSSLGSLAAAGATTINISGDALLTSAGETLTAATAINVTNTAGVTLTTALGNATAFTSVGGADAITVGATTKAITTGAGNDTVTMSVAVGTGGSVDAGDGTADVLFMTSANAATVSAGTTFEAGITNFEVLSLGATGAADAVNVANIDDISTVISAGVTAGGLALSGLGATNSVTFTNAVSGASSIALATATGSTDVVNVNLEATNGFSSASVLTIDAVETINVTTNDTDSTAATTRFTQEMAANAVKTLNVSGDVGLIIGSVAGTTLTAFNASGVTATGVLGGVAFYATGALAAASSFTGGAGADKFTANNAVAAVTMDGGAGDDELGGGTVADTLIGGTGTDVLVGFGGADMLTGGSDAADVFVYATTTPLHSNGVNQDTITDFVAGTDKISTTGTYVTYLGEANGYGAVLTSLSGTALEAVLDTSTSTLYIDVDGSQTLDAADITISMTGVTNLSQSDFATNVGTAGADTITIADGTNDVVLGLAGADTIDTGTLADVITTGSGADIVVQSLADSIARSASSFAAATVAAGDTITFGNGVDVISDFTAGTGGDVLNIAVTTVTTLIGETVANLTAGTESFFVSGNFNQTTGVFTITANGAGADTAIVQAENATVASNALTTNASIVILVGVDSDLLVAANYM